MWGTGIQQSLPQVCDAPISILLPYGILPLFAEMDSFRIDLSRCNLQGTIGTLIIVCTLKIILPFQIFYCSFLLQFLFWHNLLMLEFCLMNRLSFMVFANSCHSSLFNYSLLWYILSFSKYTSSYHRSIKLSCSPYFYILMPDAVL